MGEFDKELGELQKNMKAIKKKYGKGIARQGEEIEQAIRIPRVSTGSFTLDVELGGGIPENRITMIAGHEGSGKTTMALKMASYYQDKYPQKKVLWVDAESALDVEWMKKHGVNTEQLILITPQYQEQALDIVDTSIRTGGISAAFVDSMTALLPGREMEGSMEDEQMALQARYNSKFMRKVSSSMRVKRGQDVSLILLNQLRSKVASWGAPDTIPGGRAIKFYSSVIISLKRGDWREVEINGEKESIGQECKFLIRKNRTYAPNRKGAFDLYFKDADGFEAGEIDRLKEVVTYAVLWGIITRRGAWYYINKDEDNEVKRQGKEALLDFLRENPDVLEGIENKVKNKVIDDDKKSNEDDKIVEKDGKLINTETGEVLEE